MRRPNMATMVLIPLLTLTVGAPSAAQTTEHGTQTAAAAGLEIPVSSGTLFGPYAATHDNNTWRAIYSHSPREIAGVRQTGLQDVCLTIRSATGTLSVRVNTVRLTGGNWVTIQPIDFVTEAGHTRVVCSPHVRLGVIQVRCPAGGCSYSWALNKLE